MTPLRLLLGAALAFAFLGRADAQEASKPRWYKGNTHTHTFNTDGDSSPIDVVRFYRDQGYNFLILSDHDSITPTDGLNAMFRTAESNATDRTSLPFHPFLLVPGEEVTDAFIPEVPEKDRVPRDLGRKEIHLIALNPKTAKKPSTASATSQATHSPADLRTRSVACGASDVHAAGSTSATGGRPVACGSGHGACPDRWAISAMEG